jgi:hypothetical protein
MLTASTGTKSHRLSSARVWAEAEFSGACLGDRRLLKRLVTVSADFLENINASIPDACGGNWTKTKGAYRFFANEQVTAAKLLEGHRLATGERAREHPVLLGVQDTSVLDFTTHPKTSGLGLTGSTRARGLFLHTTLMVTPDGAALGIVNAQTWVLPPEERGKAQHREEMPLSEKESNKWLKSFHALAEWAKAFPNAQVVSVADREGDLYNLFLAATAKPHIGVLVRSKQARRLQGETELSWENLSAQPSAGITEVRVPRQPGQPARVAKLEIRYSEVTLRPPARKPNLPPVTVWLVEGREIHSSAAKPLHWRLVTTVKVCDFEQAVERLRWYEKRWVIEEFHRVLKSGCGAEKRQLESVERLEKILMLDMIVAWKIMEMRRLAREEPESSANLRLDVTEVTVLKKLLKKKADAPLGMREAIRAIAKMGGFLGRKGDGEPGTTTIWRGFKRLEHIIEGYTLHELMGND